MTYTDLSQALYQFWSQFSWDDKPIPAYKQGHVPEDAVFPYFTFRVSASNFGGSSIQTAVVWCKHTPGMNVNAQRSGILDQVAIAVPENGKLIRMPTGGGMWIQRNVDFLSDYEPPDNTDTSDEDEGEPVIGGRVSCIVNFY